MGKLAAIVTEVQARLTAATATGRPLFGYKLHTEPVDRIEGLTDLPAVAVVGFEVGEEYEGGPAVNGTVDVAVMVVVRKSLGAAAFAQALENVMDSIETSAAGNLDPALSGLSAQHIEFNARDMTMTPMSLAGVVVVSVARTPYQRGTRRT